jgi:4-amino-4-deoxy-L-arabinose transferase-like glycosyltransferase
MKTSTLAERAQLRRIIIASIAVFVVAFGVRLLAWHDTRREVEKVQTVVAANYQHAGRLFREEGVRGFFSTSGRLADPNMLGHPPGYPILIAVVWSVAGESNASIQLFQIACDAFAAVLIFLIAVELFPFAVGAIAGLLVGLAPQFTWNSVLLLPDTLAVLPLLMAAYFLTRAVKKPRLLTIVVAGACVGLSCWLRANALFMAPFLGVVILFLFERKRRFQFAGLFLAAALLIIAPLTIRNWIVFHHFIPVSLGAGQTMLEGISDYDPQRRFGIPNTDMGIMKMEAEQHNRPDYYSSLFAPDGIKRERMRLARAFEVVRENPLWFAGVMVRRAASMLRLERARRISPEPAVSHYAELSDVQRIWIAAAGELTSERFPVAELEDAGDGQILRTTSATPKHAMLVRSSVVPVRKSHEYVFRVPATVSEGRVSINVAGAESNKLYGSVIVEKAEVKEGQAQPTQIVELPFMSSGDEAIRVVIHNAAAESEHSVVSLGAAEIFELGPASFVWTRYPRLLINGLQRLFITAVMLPLALLGILILIRRRQLKTLLLLLSVPAYYFCFQSMLHTEYRYVLAVHYFLFILVGLSIYEISQMTLNFFRSRTNAT